MLTASGTCAYIMVRFRMCVMSIRLAMQGGNTRYTVVVDVAADIHPTHATKHTSTGVYGVCCAAAMVP